MGSALPPAHDCPFHQLSRKRRRPWLLGVYCKIIVVRRGKGSREKAKTVVWHQRSLLGQSAPPFLQIHRGLLWSNPSEQAYERATSACQDMNWQQRRDLLLLCVIHSQLYLLHYVYDSNYNAYENCCGLSNPRTDCQLGCCNKQTNSCDTAYH